DRPRHRRAAREAGAGRAAGAGGARASAGGRGAARGGGGRRGGPGRRARRPRSPAVGWPAMGFRQAPPRLGNQYLDDALAREVAARLLPDERRAAAEEEYAHLGELAAGELYEAMLAERLVEPRLVQWSAWGERVD